MLTLRRLLEELHLMKGRLMEEERQLSETRAEFDAKLRRMEAEAEAKRRRVRFLELQVEATQRKQTRRKDQ